eukprot:2515530-Prymnesium_polylepis.1
MLRNEVHNFATFHKHGAHFGSRTVPRRSAGGAKAHPRAARGPARAAHHPPSAHVHHVGRSRRTVRTG